MKVRRICVLLDSQQSLSDLIQYGTKHNLQFNVFLDIDPGYHRTGANPSNNASIHLAKQIKDSPVTNLIGIYSHAGHSYHSHNADEIKSYSGSEADTLSEFAKKLKEQGIIVESIAMGSTPTCSKHPDSLGAVNEIHPGNYVFYDVIQALIGTCTMDECVGTVLATVISHYT